MKQFSVYFLFLLFIGKCYAQPNKLCLPSDLKSKYRPVAAERSKAKMLYQGSESGTLEFNWPQEITIGYTANDLQSSASSQAGRLAVFNDGTLAAVWSLMWDTLAQSDKGTGYAYFDGNEWTPLPEFRVESMATDHPVISPLGAGEIIVAEKIPAGPVHLSKRGIKGSGSWLESDIPMPQGVPGLVHPAAVTGGLGNTSIYVLALTKPVSGGGVPYRGQDGALVLLQSNDGGNSWNLDDNFSSTIDSNSYNGFQPGTYAIAEPRGNQLAFVIGDPWSDLVLVKSDDNGNSWQKTLIWQHPVPFWNGQATDSIYCPDGSVHLAFDENGLIHVVFGITRLFSDGNQAFRFPFVGGIGHWKEGQSVWINGDQANSLNPDSLEIQGNLACSYLLDWNGNGNLDFLWNFPDYGVGPISFPQIAFDQYGVGMLLMSSVTEAYNDDINDYRHIWYKYLYQGQVGNIAFDWNNQPEHLFHEAVFPSLGKRSPDNLGWPFIYQMDDHPGMAVTGDHLFTQNSINRVDLYYMLPVPVITVNLVADPSEGGLVTGGGSFFYGSEVTILATPAPGYVFENWTSENVIFSNYPLVTFEALWNYNLEAHFRLISSRPEWEETCLVYPNPASATLNISLSKTGTSESVSIAIVDVLGHTCLAGDYPARESIVLDIGGIDPGYYTILIRDKQGRELRRKILTK